MDTTTKIVCDLRSKLTYSCTNESLTGIIKGLDIQEADSVLAICGSGDQAFAMAEYCQRVVAVDHNAEQIRFAKQRQDALRRGDYEKFLETPPTSGINDPIFRNSYFKEGERLDRLQLRADRIEFQIGDFRESVDGTYSKLYLSNMAAYDLTEMAEKVKTGTLLYISDQVRLRDIGARSRTARTEVEWPTKLQRDERLTALAREFKDGTIVWSPIVFKKAT